MLEPSEEFVVWEPCWGEFWSMALQLNRFVTGFALQTKTGMRTQRVSKSVQGMSFEKFSMEPASVLPISSSATYV